MRTKLNSYKLHKLQVKDYSWKILKLIEQKTVSFINKDIKLNFQIECYPFYNCRERSFCIVVKRWITRGNQLNIVFGEHRNSDAIFIDAWEADVAFNGPDVSMFTDEAYEKRVYLGYDKFEKAADLVVAKIQEYVDKN